MRQTQWRKTYLEICKLIAVINDEIDEAWRNASAAVERYGGYLEAVKAVTQELKDITDSVSLTVGEVDDADYEAQARAVRAETPKQTSNSNSGAVSSIMNKINTMQDNSNAYKSDAKGNGAIATGSDNQKNLAKENEKLAGEIESMLPDGFSVVRELSSGVWYLSKSGNGTSYQLPLYDLSEKALRNLFEVHHVGGVAGNKSTVKQDEVFALLQKGEAIFTKDQQSSLMRILDFSKAIAGKFDSIAMNGANFLTGQLKDLTQSSMTPAYAGASNVSYDINVPVQIFPAQKMDESEIKSLTSKISDYTIKSINNDMGRRGIRGGTKRF